MPCAELNCLRAEATRIKDHMREQRLKARARMPEVRAGRPSGTSELLPFLQQKLQRLSETIERHLAVHHCQQ